MCHANARKEQTLEPARSCAASSQLLPHLVLVSQFRDSAAQIATSLLGVQPVGHAEGGFPQQATVYRDTEWDSFMHNGEGALQRRVLLSEEEGGGFPVECDADASGFRVRK